MLNKDILNHYLTIELIDNLYHANPKLLDIIIRELSIKAYVKSDIDNIKFYCEKSLLNTINVLTIINTQNI